MRRLLLVAVAALAVAAPARAATLTLSLHDFSPLHARLTLSAQLTLPRQVGVGLVTWTGRPVGWIVPPSRRTELAIGWDGRIAGRLVPDGEYLVRLVYRSTVLATQPLRIDTRPPRLYGLRIDDNGPPFQGDSRYLATVSPNGDGFRDVARIHFRLREEARVTMDVTRTAKVPTVVYTLTERLGRGLHTLIWSPSPKLNPRTYLIRLTAVDNAGNRITYGAPNAHTDRYPRGVVVRLQGIDAGFMRPSYAPGDTAQIHVATDATSLTLRVFQAGPEKVITYADNQLAGVEVDEAPVTIDWSTWRSRSHMLDFRVPALPSGLYYVQLGSPDGRIGYAPFVIHPSVFGSSSRVLVVLPTNTWQAYNFQDVDGNGYGDTWYAGPSTFVKLDRGYIARGVPSRFYRYDLPFLHWFYWSGKQAEFISDSDFNLIANGDALRRAYDLVVFEGHEEYVTSHEYDVVQRFRDLGGNLMFLSADNFMWRVDETPYGLQKVGAFRDAGRPEASLIGVQYRGNDDGTHRGQFVVQSAATAPWLWDGTGLADGSLFGAMVGGYGIEIDSTTPQSPPGTMVLAQIPDLYGPGYTAQMTYYETAAGAKVFAAGALNFGGSATFWPVKRMLDNVWARLSAPGA